MALPGFCHCNKSDRSNIFQDPISWPLSRRSRDWEISAGLGFLWHIRSKNLRASSRLWGNIDWHSLSAYAHPGIFLLIFERVGGTIRIAFVQPQAKPVRIRTGGFMKAWLINKTHPRPTVIAAAFELRMR